MPKHDARNKSMPVSEQSGVRHRIYVVVLDRQETSKLCYCSLGA